MRRSIANDRDGTIGDLADAQHGLVTRAQLLERGLSASTIDRAVRHARLRPVFRGVYGVGHIALAPRAWWKAALLACGDRAALAHHSAAACMGLRHGPTLPVDVITTGGRRRTQPNLATHRMRLHAHETMVIDGLRLTVPARTIVDLAAVLGPRSLRELIERAQDLGRFDAVDIRATIDRRPRRPGSRALRDLLDLMQPDATNARSHLERLFLALIRKAGLPHPRVNEQLGQITPDFIWPEQRLVVEVDSRRWHASNHARRRDHRRDRQLTSQGWRPVRFTYEEVAFEPAAIAGELTHLMHAPARLPTPRRHRYS